MVRWEFRFTKAKFDWISLGDIVCVYSTILVGGSLAAEEKKIRFSLWAREDVSKRGVRCNW
jgi:hypothetical protein